MFVNMGKIKGRVIVLVLSLLFAGTAVLSTSVPVSDAGATVQDKKPAYQEGRYIVKLADSPHSISAFTSTYCGLIENMEDLPISGFKVVTLREHFVIPFNINIVDKLQENPMVEYAEPDYYIYPIRPVKSEYSVGNTSHFSDTNNDSDNNDNDNDNDNDTKTKTKTKTNANTNGNISTFADTYTGPGPDDEYFFFLWGLHNYGQEVFDEVRNYFEGIAGYDIRALDAWEISRGKNVQVGVFDTGIWPEHEDLAANFNHNDSKAFYDGERHSKFYFDHYVDSHGTHVAGTIAAVADNGIGVAGVAPEANVVSINIISTEYGEDDARDAEAFVSDVIRAVHYAENELGLMVTNHSWSIDTTELPRALEEVIAGSEMLFVVAAGNYNIDNDRNEEQYSDIVEDNVGPSYPGAYVLPNLIAVAAVDNRGGLGYFSNYGAGTVEVGAPGVAILSTVSPYEENNYYPYDVFCGTSSAAPHVAGIAALMFSVNPDLTAREAAEIIKTTGYDLESLQGKTSTGKMVDAFAAVTEVQNRLRETGDEPTETDSPPENRFKAGDVNGDGTVSVDDVILVLRDIMGLLHIDDDESIPAGGVARATFHDGSSRPHAGHAIRILRIIVGLE